MTERPTRTLLVAGTASHVGKSTLVAGVCRALADQGVDVTPFKAQNMSNNARSVVSPGGEDGEVGVSQYVQARAARVTPTTDHNPVLLKPRGDGESQLVIHGEAVGHFGAGEYYDEHWDRARRAVEESYRRLAAAHEVIVAEGAGSVAEINLQDRDLANVETVRIAQDAARARSDPVESGGADDLPRSDDATPDADDIIDVLLVGDIERGGVFASLYGSLELAPDVVRRQVSGVAVNKFRGERSVLEPGLAQFEDLTGTPVLGVLPYDDPGLPEEDSVSLPAADERRLLGTDDGVSEARTVTVVVPRFPRISNFTDLEPLAREPGVRVSYRPLDAGLDDADAVVLPGTKNTVDDLLACREAGLDERLGTFEGPVVGICGGYQLLGERVTNAALEGIGDHEVVRGFGLLPVETRFAPEKTVERATTDVEGVGPLAGATGTVEGYEIHAGETTVLGEVARPLGPGSVATDRVLGTYLHGLFENESARGAFVDAVYAAAGKRRPDAEPDAVSPLDAAADLVTAHLDLSLPGWPTGGHRTVER
ncbi:cobyric acid synthase [Salinirubellus sp. GCM10025818]|uniref:cobyric acid synthase n=1 Tax=Salinirubellus TaxID=2162630 RepID=UPI0030CC3CFE